MVVRIDLEKGSRIDFRRLGVEQIKFVGSGLKGKLESIGVNHISFKLPDDTEVARLNPDSSSFELIKPKLQGDLNANGYRVTNVGNVLPNSDNTYSLGSESVRWKEVNSVSVVSNHVKAKWQDIETIYVSPDGGGDGSSPDSPTTLDDALTRARARRVVIVLADGEYHISKSYGLFGDYVEIKSQSGDASKVKIVFDTYVSGNYNMSYSLRLYDNVVLRFSNVTLENAPKANTDYGWSVGGGAWAPISVTGDTVRQGVLMFLKCVINQTRDYFISAKHGAGAVIFSGTTINMSEDAVAFIDNGFGVVHIGWYNSSITSGYKLTTGLQGRDVLFSGNINSVSASKTWFSEVPESVLPRSDNAYDLGSASARWRSGRFGGNVVVDGYIAAQCGYDIKSEPPSIPTSKKGWKIGLWGSGYYIGVASWSMALKTDGWVSVFRQTCAADDGTSSEPDSNATISLGGNGEIWFKKDFRLYTGGVNTLKLNATALPDSDNAFNLGSSSLRWANVYAVNIYTGDINLDNGWRITEYDENGKLMNGVRILNANGEEVLRITEDGVWFRGKKIAE